ncbi:MAG: hypothetical protein WBM00_12370 [Solirubrobacterales bacterium]
MPVAAARLADVGTRDPQPLELGRSRQHVRQQLAVPVLQRGPIADGATHLGDPHYERVAHGLQLSEVERTRHG